MIFYERLYLEFKTQTSVPFAGWKGLISLQDLKGKKKRGDAFTFHNPLSAVLALMEMSYDLTRREFKVYFSTRIN
jgi:hypothetical protein